MLTSLITPFRILQQKLYNPYVRYCSWLASIASKPEKDAEKDRENCELLVVTIAFNKPDLIKKQLELMQENFKDKDYIHVIADNSNKKALREEIADICNKANVRYVPVPRFLNQLSRTRLFWYGVSEGTALNWLWNKYIIGIKPRRMAIIDHDLLPIKETSLIDKLGTNDFYGADRFRGDSSWYLWPGYVIFNCNKMWDKRISFQPCFIGKTFLDAGGWMYHSLYKDYKRDNNMFAKVETYNIVNDKNQKNRNDDIYHRNCIQIIDGSWLHLINGSNYAKLKGKEGIMKNVLNNLEKFK